MLLKLEIWQELGTQPTNNKKGHYRDSVLLCLKELKVCVICKGLTVVVHLINMFVVGVSIHLTNFNIQMDWMSAQQKEKELEEAGAQKNFISLSDDGHHQMFFNEILRLFFFARYIHLVRSQFTFNVKRFYSSRILFVI